MREIEEEFIELTDEDGKKQKFEILDVVTKGEDDYVILLPDDSEEDVVILKVVYSDDSSEEVEYIELEDEKLADEIFEEFVKNEEE